MSGRDLSCEIEQDSMRRRIICDTERMLGPYSSWLLSSGGLLSRLRLSKGTAESNHLLLHQSYKSLTNDGCILLLFDFALKDYIVDSS